MTLRQFVAFWAYVFLSGDFHFLIPPLAKGESFILSGDFVSTRWQPLQAECGFLDKRQIDSFP